MAETNDNADFADLSPEAALDDKGVRDLLAQLKGAMAGQLNHKE